MWNVGFKSEIKKASVVLTILLLILYPVSAATTLTNPQKTTIEDATPQSACLPYDLDPDQDGLNVWNIQCTDDRGYSVYATANYTLMVNTRCSKPSLADANSDCKISDLEILSYITKWNQGTVTAKELFNAIEVWKQT